MTVVALLLAATSLAMLMFTSKTTTTPVEDRREVSIGPPQSAVALSGPTSLEELLALPADELAKIDIARLNLIAAEGLPGTEHLDLQSVESELDRWAAHVKRETDRHLYQFRADPADYENSEAYFRALMLITVLQQDLGVRYNPDRINDPDFTNSKDLFIHGMVKDRNGGTCVSMPTLYVAIGRRLGYPMCLTVTKGHVFARWDAPDHPLPGFRDRFNIEATSPGLSVYADEHYTTFPYKLSKAEIDRGWYLRSLTPVEEFAVFLTNRGYCLEDTGRTEEAKTAYRTASRLAPKSEAGAFLAALNRREVAPGQDLAVLADLLSDRHRQAYIGRMAERQRTRGLGPLVPLVPVTPSSPSGLPSPPRPLSPGYPDREN